MTTTTLNLLYCGVVMSVILIGHRLVNLYDLALVKVSIIIKSD
jgi:hypothetical protein